MTRFSYHYITKGEHVHVRVFANGAKAGDLVFRVAEWKDFIRDVDGDKVRDSGQSDLDIEIQDVILEQNRG